MKIKKIISSVLLAAMVISMIAVLPMTASAAYTTTNVASSSSATADLSKKELEEYLASYIAYDYDTPEEMLEDELEAGYLYSVNSVGNLYSIYVNKYTGFMFYKNNTTGQILTSNPIDPANSQSSDLLMSQIEISFSETAKQKPYTYQSYTWAALNSQISVSPISGGLRVNYSLGDTTPRFLLPGAITVPRFEEYILGPMLEAYTNKVIELVGDKVDEDVNLEFFGNEDYVSYNETYVEEHGEDAKYINTAKSKKTPGYRNYMEDMNKICAQYYKNTTAEMKSLQAIDAAINVLLNNYPLQNPLRYEEGDDSLKVMNEKYPITKDGVMVYACTTVTDADKRNIATKIKTYCHDYTFAMMYADEKECGYVDKSESKPVFRCAIEYSFNKDGSLSVCVPASSITFDATVYTLTNIKPLQYFGAADINRDGYIFFPDGSGTIVEFADFSADKSAYTISATPYGYDYCYSEIKGSHRQQATMPVYGLVTEVDSNAKTVEQYGKDVSKTGYFAILEEGSALATLNLSTGGSSHKYGSAFATYAPFPADTVEVTSGGDFIQYPKVAETKYTGSYVTRIVMLVDEEIGAEAYGEGAFYEADYVGMAAYYRNYLKENGTLSAIKTVSDDLPLYVEVLGAMDITAKILSFPVTKSIPLTSFEDVVTMYRELSDCKNVAAARAAENEKLAAEEKDEELKAEYERVADEYRALEAAVENISNINFRLTGFANGGMKSTYPVKLRWAKACGGDDGYRALLAESNKISAAEGTNFGVFADFDFSYINNTAMFDGIGNKGNVAKKLDNRYAAMQEYDNVLQGYENAVSLIISTDAMDKLYTKFNKDYSKFSSGKISVSTLGSDLNSNFDSDNTINRDEARINVTALLERMNKQDGYEIMTDVGNIYAIEYAKHILNAATDSSHFRYASYSVPFIGLTLHSYVNYTGTPLNYTGNVEYEILKSIENGAAPFYILCYQNSAYLKDDPDLNDYYGVSYENWYSDMLLTYTELNRAIGDLQTFELVDHEVVISERVIEDSEMAANYVTLQNEIIELLDAQISKLVDDSFDVLAVGGEANYNMRLKVNVDRAALMAQFSEILNLSVEELEGGAFAESLDALIAKYENEYPGAANAEDTYEVVFSTLDYSSKYSYITDSAAFDKDYVRTDYTIDNGNVTMVVYSDGVKTVTFFLNYNSYTVNIRLDADTVISLDKFSYQRIEGGVRK